MPNYQGINDNYLPLIPKPSLQQYGNYGIYDLVIRDTIVGSTLTQATKKLFVQAYSPSVSGVDFIQIASIYK